MTGWRPAVSDNKLYTRVSYNIFDEFQIETSQLILITRLSIRGKIDVFDKLKCH